MKIPGVVPTAMASMLLALPAASDPGETNKLTNGGFEEGLTAWQTTGKVGLETVAPLQGKASARIGPGPGSVVQRVEAGSGDHLTVSAVVKSEPSGAGKLKVRFLGKDGRELMTVDSATDMEPGNQEPRELSFYMKEHPLTAAVEIIVSKDSEGGYVMADQVELKASCENAPTLKATCDPGQYMQPFWRGKTVYHEAVLMLADEGKPATGRLMFKPARIISVKDYGLTTNYVEGADYTVDGRNLVRTPSSRMTQVKTAGLLKGELAWNKIGGKQVMASYEHDDSWTGPSPVFLGENMPNTMRKLESHAPLKVVAYGDSITHGVGESRLAHIPPFMPPWAELFVNRLKAIYKDEGIRLYNSAQSGAKSEWGAKMAGRMVASLNPDLVIIAFGQNDFWNQPANDFGHNISAIMETVRTGNPAAEFLLVATMRFDPAYSSKPEYWELVGEYEAKLKSLCGKGAQLVDMTAISEAVYAAKKPKDCLNDPLHPNDYLARWYAQSLVAALDVGSGQTPAFHSSKKGVGQDGPNIPEAVDALGCGWYYNWTPVRASEEKSIRAEFVPMIWGREHLDADLAKLAGCAVTNLLGFNEPDNEDQAGMTVAEAVALWPKLAATGMRLGSPATETGSKWLDDFMGEAKRRKLRVDFLCLHWYGDITVSNAVESLHEYLLGYWDRYHLPIWLTEFSGADFDYHTRKTTVEDNAAFAAAAEAMLEELPFVERYAWYGIKWTPQDKEYSKTGLYDAQTRTFTAVGIAYRGAAKH